MELMKCECCGSTSFSTKDGLCKCEFCGATYKTKETNDVDDMAIPKDLLQASEAEIACLRLQAADAMRQAEIGKNISIQHCSNIGYYLSPVPGIWL